MAESDSYERLAAEYYSENRHGACRNFREGSEVIVEKLTSSLDFTTVVEVGAGRSFAAPLLQSQGRSLADLVITDISPGMLAWSQPWEEQGVRLIICPANHLPLADESMSLVISLMGDPYNDASFWREAARVLLPGGNVIFTAPSHEWHRLSGDGAQAVFTIQDTQRVSVSSLVLDSVAQRELARSAGFVTDGYRGFVKKELRGDVSKAFMRLGAEDTIVDGYLFRKP